MKILIYSHEFSLLKYNMSQKTFESENDHINVQYQADFLDQYTADKYYTIFESKLEYNKKDDSKVKVFGKEYFIKRKQVAYGEDGTYYTFAGNTVYAKSWNNSDDILCRVIKNIKIRVEKKTGKKFNFVLINRYADGDDYIGAHRDDEKELGNEPTIIGVSLGSVRDIAFTPVGFIPEETPKRLTLELDHGSIFVMNHPTNTYWKHEIPKRANINKPRISLTFRYLHL